MDMMKYLGMPYKIKGRSIDGCDCYGFVRLVLSDHGIQIPVYSFTGSGCEKNIALELIPAEEKQIPSDLNIIYLAHHGTEHIGIYINGSVWTMTKNGVISKPWIRIQGQVKGIYEVKN